MVLDGVSAFPKVLSPSVSHCTPSCFPLLDGVSALPRVFSPFVSHCTLLVSPCWMVRPPFRGTCLLLSPIVLFLVSLCWILPLSPMVPLLVFPCWMVRQACRRLASHCPPLSPRASPHVCLCWMVRPPFRRLLFPFVSHCLLHMCACVGWCVGLPEVLSTRLPLSPIVSPHVCLHVLDGVFPFPRSCLPLSAFPRSCLPLSPIEPIVSHCLPLSPHTCACV